ncbi:hypothetical protein O3M35_002896 [Rhynocoris fuscipes]|uniref:Uncharacterized protein n=1 Tax=Rhynocoris fuscipes TaxID=488301 RepID=A0AAW1CN45_9HEMI
MKYATLVKNIILAQYVENHSVAKITSPNICELIRKHFQLNGKKNHFYFLV